MSHLLPAWAVALGLAGTVLAVPAPPPAPAPRPVTAAGATTREVAPAPRVAAPKFVAPKLNNVFEVLIFTTQRPVRVRVTALTEGKSMDDLWRDRMKKLFEFCDRDDDGFLSAKELAFAFSDQGLLQLLSNGFYQPTPSSSPSLAAIDKNRDGKLSFEEFLASYPRSMAQLFRALPVQPDATNNAPVTEALFKLLDANGDGKLTEGEVRSVEKLLATRDSDEDECLSMSELVPGFNDPRLGQPVQFAVQGQPNGRPYGNGLGSQPVVAFPAGRVPGTVTQLVIKKYDKDGDFELTRDEIGFDDLTFKALDRDGNGRLDGEEFEAWRTGAPDLDLTLTLGAKAADCVAKLADENAAEARGFKVKHLEGGRLVIHVGRQPIDFWAFSPVAQFRQPALKQQFGYLFTQAAGGKGHVEEKDLGGPNAVQFQFIRVMFETADRDGNGNLTKAEFDAYFDLQESFRNLSLSLTPGVQTPSLFDLLDENRDGRLSVRELRTAWKRLCALEAGNPEVVTKQIIQPSITLRLTHSFDRGFVNQPVQFIGRRNPNQVAVPQRGPLWFRKMDRNGDGDVSRMEFIGTKEEFDAIDTDHDDLISLEEATAFDKNRREPETPAPPPDKPKPDKPKPERKEQEK